MMELFLLIAAILTLLMLQKKSEQPKLLFAAVSDDEDIRIAGAAPRRAPSSDGEDNSATDYVSHQTMGNIETAIQLGGCLARLFCTRFRQLTDEQTAEIAKQLIILDSYAVNRAVQNMPNSLIAQTVLSTFYNVVGQESSSLYQAVRDPVPFSLYILRDRKSFPTESYGEVFASLCGMPDNAELAALADTEYQQFFDQCGVLTGGFSFHEV